MNESLEMRLNITHAAIARAGTSRPTGWLDDQIIDPPSPDEAPVSRPNKMPDRMAKRRIDRAAAEKMAADLAGYDSRIKGGRLEGAP